MYSIILTNGKITHIKADLVEWNATDRTIKLINDRRTVARINMDSVVGWIDTDYEVEIEESEDQK